MTQLTDALSKALAACESEEKIVEALVDIGWTPPHEKTASPKEPVRAWVNKYGIDTKGFHYDLENAQRSLCAGGKTVPLIEEGWCQLIPHDGSAECPVDPDVSVVAHYNTMGIGAYKKAKDVHYWHIVTAYAVLLPVEEGHVY